MELEHHRPSKDEYYMMLAKTVATRGTCPKALVGAVLVKDGSIISTGYNGAPVGEKHCSEAGHNEVDGHCQRAVHAELNAILQAAKHGNATKDSTLYITHFPCNHCLKAIANAGIKGIVYEVSYKNMENFISLDHFELRQVKSSFAVQILDISEKKVPLT
ncbi:dCMP deaminase family protein [Candidatus Peregrinibacteria bacterium]|nr:dCMP deaminase family protein [Candidatus Peregrinibacteria bacterium]